MRGLQSIITQLLLSGVWRQGASENYKKDSHSEFNKEWRGFREILIFLSALTTAQADPVG